MDKKKLQKSSMKKNLLIIDVNPFGDLTDTVKWVEYLKVDWNVTVLCFAGKDGSKANADGYRLIQLRNFRKRQIKGVYFILYSLFYLLFFKGKVVVEFFPLCEIYKKIFSKKKMLLDVRTLSVSSDESIRSAYNARIKKACLCFDKVTAISEGVVRQIGLKGIEILPLGSDVISSTEKVFTDSIRLLYVGTFTNRSIEQTIEGVIAFHKEHSEIPIKYNIVGYGNDNEEIFFQQIIDENGADEYIHIIGKVSHDALKTYFDKCNAGFSFVPITDYYNDQPPTKTYEYCLSGMFCIGTATTANKQLINANNGVLISDTAEGVRNGLKYYWDNRSSFNPRVIMKTLESCTWEKNSA